MDPRRPVGMQPRTTHPGIVRGRLGRALGLSLALALSCLAPFAAALTVSNLNNAGAGSLRDAVAGTPAGGTVDFAPALTGTIVLTSGEIGIAKNLTIAGPGADRVTVSGNNASRIFNLTSGTAAVTISGLRLAGGATAGAGGAIASIGALTLDAVWVQANAAGDGGGGVYVGRPDVAASGTAIIRNSTLTGNSVATPGGAGGGALLALGAPGAAAAVTLQNSTVSGNTASASAGMGGGGVAFVGAGITLVSSTLAYNTAAAGGANLHQGALAQSSLTLRNSIVSNGTLTTAGVPAVSRDLYQPAGATVNSLGYNVVQVRSGAAGWAASDAPNGTDPQLAALAANGGPTPTHALAAASPAVNLVPIAACVDAASAPLLRDQRGVARQVGGDPCDAGSFERASIGLSPATLANARVGAVYAATLTGVGGTAPYTFAVTAGSLPAGLSLSTAGAFSGTPTAGGVFSFTVTVTDASAAPGPYTGSKAYTLTVDPALIGVAPSSLPTPALGVAYGPIALTATGGTAPYVWSLQSGALPGGVTLSAAGVIAGTPTSVGPFSFTVAAVDSSTGTGPYTGTRAYGITVPPPTIFITPGALPPGATIGVPYGPVALVGGGGTAPYTFGVTAGALPPGLSLTTGGVLSGTPTGTGSYSFTVQATDATGAPGPFTGTQGYSLAIDDADAPVRVFVAASGNDANACSLQQPCQSIQRGIARVKNGGTVVVVEGGSYAPIVVGKPLTLEVLGTVAAGIAVTGGDAVVVRAGGGSVLIDGLTLNIPGGGAPPPGSRGIVFESGDLLALRRVTVQGFADGVLHAPVTPGWLTVDRSQLRGNGNGYRFVDPVVYAPDWWVRIADSDLARNGTAIEAAGRVQLELRDARLVGNDRGLAAGGGVLPQPGPAAVVLWRSVLGDNATSGIVAPGTPSNPARINAHRIGVHDGGTGLSLTGGSTAHLSGSTISGNGTGISASGSPAPGTSGDNVLRDNAVNGSLGTLIPNQ